MSRSLLLLALALLLVPAAAQAAFDPSAPIPVDPKVRIGTLENGLTFDSRQNTKPENRASLRLAVNDGSLMEEDDQQGLAHFLEHMAFNGTANFAHNELVSFLESLGTRFGPDLNAYTSFDETVYMLEVPTDTAGVLDQGILVLSDWAARITLDPEEVEKERGVVLDEWRRGLGAGERIRKIQWPVLFRDSRYAERLPIGLAEVIQNAPAQRLQDFYTTWYRPDYMAVVAVGDFDPDQVEAMIRAHFGSIPKPETPLVRPVYPVPHHDEMLAVPATDKEMPRTTVSVVFKHEARDSGTLGDLRTSLVDLLFTQMLNRRFSELREKPDAPFLWGGTGVGSQVRTLDAFRFFAATREGEVERGLTAGLTEIQRVRLHGFTAGELERVKADLTSQVESMYAERDKTENNDYVGQYVDHFLEGDEIAGVEFYYEVGIPLIQEITLAEVNGAIDRLIHEDNTVILATGPEKDGAALPTAEELLATARAAAALTPEPYEDSLGGAELLSELPAPGTVTARREIASLGVSVLNLSNGVEVWLKPTNYKNDEILFRGQRAGGTSLVSPADYVSASLATALLSEAGFGGFTPSEIRKLLAGKEASASPYVSTFTEGIAGSARPQDLETALQLAYLCWTQPNDREDAYAVLTDRWRSIIENRSVDPNARFGDRLMEVNYQDHYMYQPPSLEMLEVFSREKAMAFYRERTANAGGMTFWFVGNFDPAEIEPLVLRYLGSLPGTPGHTSTWKDPGIHFPNGITEEVVYAGSEPKSSTVITWPAPVTEDEYAMFYMRMAADALRIRLREIMREELGETYGVGMSYSALSPYNQYSTTSISFGCAPEHAGELTGVAMTEAAKFASEGPTDEETQKVREQEIRAVEEREQENGYWLNSFSTLALFGWDAESILGRAERARSITKEKLHEASKDWFPQDRFTRMQLMPEDAAKTGSAAPSGDEE